MEEESREFTEKAAGFTPARNSENKFKIIHLKSDA
jgi:hypothetical protein